jgi:adenylate kinase family enzyme
VIVSGAPGSGKSTLAERLAPALGLPHLAKDRLQHVLLDALGTPSAEAGRRLGAAAFDQM